MKDLSDIIRGSVMEQKGDPIDDQWINDEKPVMIKSGLQVIITDIDRSVVPNVIKGKVKQQNSLYDFEWLDDGTCTKAVDNIGNPKKPDDSDSLVKAV